MLIVFTPGIWKSHYLFCTSCSDHSSALAQFMHSFKLISQTESRNSHCAAGQRSTSTKGVTLWVIKHCVGLILERHFLISTGTQFCFFPPLWTQMPRIAEPSFASLSRAPFSFSLTGNRSVVCVCGCTVLISIHFGFWKTSIDNIPWKWLKKWFRLSSRKLTVLVWSLVCEQCLMSCVTNKNELNYEWNDRKNKKAHGTCGFDPDYLLYFVS